MKLDILRLISIVLCFATLFAFASCNATSENGEITESESQSESESDIELGGRHKADFRR